MHLLIAGQSVEFADVGVYEDRFGSTEGFDVVPYELQVAKSDLRVRLAPAYEQCVQELKRDDEIVGHFQPPFEGALDYPSVSDLLELESEQLFEFLEGLLDYEVVRAFVQEAADRGGKLKWLLLTVDSIAVNGEVVRITGRARRAPAR